MINLAKCSGLCYLGVVSIVRESAGAYLMAIDGKDVWIPKSQADVEFVQEGEAKVTLTAWISEQKGIVK